MLFSISKIDCKAVNIVHSKLKKNKMNDMSNMLIREYFYGKQKGFYWLRDDCFGLPFILIKQNFLN